MNLWSNRLVGDDKLPAEQRRTRTNVPTNPQQPLLSPCLPEPVWTMKGESYNDEQTTHL